MAVNAGPDIIEDGIVLCLDAANSRSYPGTGTTWSDLAESNNGTLTNGPTFDAGNGGSIVFDGSNDYVDTGMNPSYSAVTISCWFQYSDTFTSIVMGRYNDWINAGVFRIPANGIIGVGGQATGNGYDSMSPDSSLAFSAGQWVNTVFTYNGSIYRSYHQGLAGDTISRSHTFSSVSSQNIWIGRRTSDASLANYYSGKISNVSIYNRALTADEIRRNYNATKGRYA
jgi:hypothetical protein|tara:strand:+ start:884 stop:1564 length:681 start_codon:yes stop_codon:yes gene_type:complete